MTVFFVAIIFAMIGISVSTLLPTFAFSFTSPPVTNANSSVTYKEISAQVKSFIFDQIVNKSNAAIVIGFVDPDGTKIFSFGNMSTAHNIPVNQNTFFNIGSITKTFTTLLLADMVKQGIVNLNDPVEKFLPPSVEVPQFNGKKITLEDLADHTSGLPEWPSNVCLKDTVGDINPNYNVTQLYQALSDTKLTREPGSEVQYSSFGIGLLGHILSLESDGISYEELVKDRILDVLGMNDTKIALSQNETNNRFSVGHLGGKEIITPRIPTILADSGAFRSTAPDMLKYVSANLGLIHTKLDDAMQLGHLIRHSSIIANPMNYSEYRGLGWRVLTNFGTETITHTGAINGWNAFAGFIPTKQVGVIAMCSCDSTDADMGSLGFVLLHLTGVENINAKSEPRTHTTPGS
ncbi:MAG: serine hydrolase domain-containing protein [Nitrososphaeraceae archaeon]